MKQARYALMIPVIAFALIFSAIMPMVSADAGSGAKDLNDQSTGNKWNWTEGYTSQNGMGFLNQGEKPSQKALEWMLQEGARYGMMAQLNYSNGVVAGEFIRFELNQTTGMITNFTLISGDVEIVVFDSVSMAGFLPEEVALQGSVMLIKGGAIQIIIHDNPTSMIHVITNGTLTTVSFIASENVQVTEGAIRDREYVSINGTGVDAVLATDNGTIFMDEVGGRTFLNVTFEDDHLMFRAIPTFTNRNMESEQALMQAFVQSRLAGEISLLVRNDTAMYNTMEYQHHFRIQLMEAHQNRIMLQVSSDDHEGRMVVMTMDRETLQLQNRELVVKMDGTAIREGSMLDVLNATGQQGDNAAYCMLTQGDISQVLVYIPSFSAHALSVESAAADADVFGQIGLIALIAVVGVIGVVAIVLIKRRR
jgi:hypothetical protein